MKTKGWIVGRLAAVVVVAAVLTIVVSCAPAKKPVDPNAVSAEVVATIGDYAITKGQLIERLQRAIRPQREDYGIPKDPATAETVLMDMIAEKAMILEGRKLGYAEDEAIRSSVERYRDQMLLRTLLQKYLRENVSVEEAEIDAQIKAKPELTRDQARTLVERTKAGPLFEAFYGQLEQKFQPVKNRENISRTAVIHQRLLTKPATPRKRTETWIKNSQVQNELTPAEKSLVLVTFKGGQFTLEQWFKALGQIAPPGRPRDLNTSAGVEKLLDQALKPVILVAEACARGYDRDEELIQAVRKIEDDRVLGKFRSDKTKDVAEPNDGQIKAYFDAHTASFGMKGSVQLDQIWCKDLETAQKVKAELDGGAEFASLRTTYSLKKDSQPGAVYPSSEGLFWETLWQADPNDVVGPIKGFLGPEVRWRVAKVLAKTPPQAKPYSDSVKNTVKWALQAQWRQEMVADYQRDLLAQYPYKLYGDRIKDIDPLEAATGDGPVQ